MIRGTISLLAAASLLAGCAFKPQLQSVAVDHNRLVADTADRLTLLNIVRAQHRMPMHFSRITTMNGNVSLSAGGTLGLSLDPGANSASPEVNGSVSTNPSFEAAVMDDEKFQRGIQSKLDPDLIAYLLESGYPDDLVFALFVERIDFTAGPGGFPNIYYRSFSRPGPEGPPRFDTADPVFDGLIRPGEPVGSIDNKPDPSYTFGNLLCAYRLSFTDAPAKMRSAKGDTLPGKVLTMQRVANPSLRCPATRKDAYKGVFASMVLSENGGRVLRGYDFDQFNVTTDENSNTLQVEFSGPLLAAVQQGRRRAATSYKLEAKVRLRSVEDTLYFLGEYIRSNDPYEFGRTEPGKSDAVCDEVGTDLAPHGQYRVFAVHQKLPPAKALVSVNFRDKTYAISEDALCPGRSGDRSASVLTLIQQLLNLNKSNDDLPRSGSVRLIGG